MKTKFKQDDNVLWKFLIGSTPTPAKVMNVNPKGQKGLVVILYKAATGRNVSRTVWQDELTLVENEKSEPEFVEGCKKCYSTEIEKVNGEFKEDWITVRCLNEDCKTYFHYWHTQLEMNLGKDWKIKPPIKHEIEKEQSIDS